MATGSHRAVNEKEESCVFCTSDWFRSAELVFRTDLSIYASTRDPRDPEEVLPGCGVIVPIVHRASAFHLTPEEWADTRELLIKVRTALDERLAPDGYVLGWNDFPRQGERPAHAHLHVVPRFDDEPLWDRGLRSAVKVPENIRPSPLRPGNGRALQR